MSAKIDRLVNQLNGTGLQQKDMPLFQVIKHLIDRLKELESAIASGGGIGQDGLTGATGAQGPPFPAFIVMEQESEEIPLPIPGPRGATGAIGPTGPAGESFPFILPEPDLPEDSITVIREIVNSDARPWELIETIAFAGAAQYDSIDLGDYNEIRIFVRGVVLSGSSRIFARVSTDNGATFLSSSGDYVAVAPTGAETNDTVIDQFYFSASISPRTGEILIRGFNMPNQKTVWSLLGLPAGVSYIIPTVTPLNAVRILATGGPTLDSGSAYIFGR